MLLLKGKLKLSEKTKRVLPHRLGSFVSGFEENEGDVANASPPLDFELGEELDTFHSNEHEPEIGIENSYDNKVDEESDLPVQVGRESLRKPVSVSAFDAAAEKQSELEFLLSREVINLERLRRIATDGLPDEGGSRATAWKLLLGYLPASRDMWERQLAENRLKYATMKDELLFNPSDLTRRKEDMEQDKDTEIGVLLRRYEISHGDHPLSDGKASIWYQYFKDAEIAEQIDRDLLRTHPNMKFFSGDSLFSRRNRQAMKNILLLFAKLNPEISYVQGMNEVLAPLYYLFITDPDEQNAANAEADSFSCFVRLLSDSVDHFCQQLDNSAVGIHSTLSHLMELLKANDEELWRHLEITNKVNPQFYAFRWITLLLTQEFNLNSIMRIWDSLLSNSTGVQEMLLRVCCAMLLCVRSRLLSGDFASNLKLLQHYPEINIEYLLQLAQKLDLSTSALPLTI